MRPDVVVTPAENLQRLPGLTRATVELPIYLLGLQRLVEALEQTQLGRRSILDAYMAVLPVDVRTEVPGEKLEPLSVTRTLSTT